MAGKIVFGLFEELKYLLDKFVHLFCNKTTISFKNRDKMQQKNTTDYR